MQLHEVCELIVDCEHKTAPTQETGCPSIRTPNIGRGRLILDIVNRVSEEVYREWTKRAVPQNNDLILAREAPAGNIAIIKNNIKVCLGQRTVLIRPNKKIINADYLMYLLLDSKMQHRLLSYGSGATVPHINMADIRKLPLPDLPDMLTQNKIVSILSAYDDLTENNSRHIKILEEMAQAIYQEWFVKFKFPGHEKVRMVDSPLGKILEGWSITRLGKLCNKINEKYNEQKHSELPLLDLARIPRKSLNVLSYGKSGELKISRIIFKKGDILFGAIRPYFHKVIFVPQDGVTNTSVFVIRANDSIMQNYLFSLLFTDYTVKWATTHSGGTKMPVIPWDVFSKMKVLLPSSRILEQFNTAVKPMFEHITILNHKNQILSKSRDILLPKLISGEIDVEDLDINVGELAK